MPDFYEHLKQQFEAIRDTEVCLQKCRDNCAALMEQSFHLFSDLQHVEPVVAAEEPAVPVTPVPDPYVLIDKITTDLPDDTFVAGIPVSDVTINYPGNPTSSGIVTVNYE